MILSLPIVAAIAAPLLLLEAFFSGSEIALLSADKLKLRAAGKRSGGAQLALELANRPERVLSITLVVTSLCVIGISSVIALAFKSDLLAVAVTSPLIVVFGELLPKTLFQKYADRIAPRVARPVAWAFFALYPITRVLSSYTTGLARIVGPIEELVTGRKKSTREDLRALLSYSKRETDMKASEKRMIKRIFDFKDTEAQHALIPLVRVDAIESTASVKQALERFQHHRHSRMPIYSNRIDNIVGILESADLFAVSDLSQPIRNFITPAHYVAETQALDDLMLQMRRDDNSMVVIVDEYGGAVGILTFEDIVEEIVGEIDDEYDTDTGMTIRQLGETSWLMPARVEIQTINEQLKLEVPEGDYETLAGFLLQQFGRIPETRDELYFDTAAGTLKFVIRRASARSIESVQVERIGAPSDS
jgi:putative hemolysin